MRKPLCLAMLMLSSVTFATVSKDKHPKIDKAKALEILSTVPSDAFKPVKVPNLIGDQVYKQLALDGWSNSEIVKLTDNYLKKNLSALRGTFDYSSYRKTWKPYNGVYLTPDPMFAQDYSESSEKVQKSVMQTFSDANQSYERIFYTPNDRKAGKRNTGYFRHVACLPAGGRIHWIAVHPEDPQKVRCIPDGDAIWATDNAGDGFPIWRCLTDNIPNRYHRSVSNCYALPFDPDDWNHLFAFMSNGKGGSVIYESIDGGESWTEIKGSSHNGAKRGYAFKDAQGNLKLIQAKGREDWEPNLWISSNKGVTWDKIVLPEGLKDTNGSRNVTGQWLQEFGFNQNSRDTVFIPTPYSILMLKEGGRKVNGQYQLERMKFNVYAADGTTALKLNTTYFPFADYMMREKKDPSPMFIEIDPNNPNKMWVALGDRSASAGNSQSAIYYSEDKGKNWRTIKDETSKTGSGNLFGNEVPWNWLGGFGVNFVDPNWMYGCSMSSAISSNGGKDFKEFSWSIRMEGYYPDGNLYPLSVSSHNADNHCIISHKSGRVYRGSDGGMLMKDKNINNNNWTNISGDMGQMLFYHITTNEFGNQMLFGNTQDINPQTYRNGYWTPHRGYEGSTGWIAPYGSRAYYPYGETGIANLDYGSWNMAYTKADVCSGYWYIRRGDKNPDGSKFSIVKDFGQEAIKLDPVEGSYVRDFALTRDTKVATLYVLTENNKMYKSQDNGNTFTAVSMSLPSVTCMAVNPDNNQELYVANNTGVYRTKDGGKSWEPITGNLEAGMNKKNLCYHEGSGDIYLVCPNDGIFLLENGETSWKLWMKGYNPAAFNNGLINYTTQEFIIEDYGRGIWLADLENPADRYYKPGFKLKEISNVDGTKTIGIDTHWTVPMYHYYTWTVNDKVVKNPYQYFTSNTLKVGDRVQLKLTLRESPDVTTLSEVYTVTETKVEPLDTKKGNMITSNGSGRIDLGHVDYFFEDFTLDFWVNPNSDGVILGNRSVKDEDSKGWYLRILNGNLSFVYSPDHQVTVPFNMTSSQTNDAINGGTIKKDEWNHIAITHERNGKISIYVDGKLRGSKNRIMPEHTLNNAIYLSLFADGFERYCLSGSIDEIKIWDKALSADDVKKDMFSIAHPLGAKLVYYNNFNAPTLQEQKETFSKAGMQPRTRAKVRIGSMSLPLDAKYSAVKKLTTGVNELVDGSTKILDISKSLKTPTVTAYEYLNDISGEGDNGFNSKYHEICPQSYMLMLDDDVTLTAQDKVTIEFHVENPQKYEGTYLFTSSILGGKTVWNKHAPLVYDSEKNVLRVEGISLLSINKVQLAIIKLKPTILSTFPSQNNEGMLVVSKDNAVYSFAAETVGDIEEPAAEYKFNFSEPFAKMLEPLQFVNGKATGKFTIDATALGEYNDIKTITLSGMDDRMMPVSIDLLNKIIPNEKGKVLKITQGGAHVGGDNTFTKLNGQNKMTVMGWVRYDDVASLNVNGALFFWRGTTKATGIYMWNGEIGCHWNDESWSWGIRSGLKIEANQIGRWFHVAMVSNGNSLALYLNGQKFVTSRTLSNLNILSPLQLGQNNSGDRTFTGQMDNVQVWSRNLSDEEIAYYMQTNPDLDDKDLVVFLNNDLTDGGGKVVETVQNAPVKEVGTMTTIVGSYPYNSTATAFKNTYARGDASVVMPQFTFGTSKPSFYVNYNEALPFTSGIISSLEKMVSKNFWTLILNQKLNLSSATKIKIAFDHPAVYKGDSLNLIFRPLGQTKSFTTRIGAKSIRDKYVEFLVPGNMIQESMEMYLVAYQKNARPVAVSITPKNATTSNIILKDGEDGVFIDAKVVGGEPSGTYNLVVEQEYASIENPGVTFNAETPSASRKIKIDRTKINKFGLNELTVYCEGSSVEPLHFTFSLEPKVELSLKNGETSTRYLAKTAISDMHIEARLVQGVIDGKIDLNLTGDLDVDYAVATAPILSNNQAMINNLSYIKSSYGEIYSGWNLVGNPYLSTINLTNAENSSLSGITRFIYQWDAVANNYKTYDLTSFDSEHVTLPLGAFMVQTMSEGAAMDIYPTAKEGKISRRTIRTTLAKETAYMVLELLVDGKKVDQTVVRFEDDARAGYLTNEDAVKFFSLEPELSNQLYTYTTNDNIPVAINRTKKAAKTTNIPLAVQLKTPGKYEIKVARMAGFSDEEWVSITDKETKEVWTLEEGRIFPFTGSSLAYKEGEGRFLIALKTVATDIENTTDGYKVNVVGNTCTVEGINGHAQILIYTVNGKMAVNKEVVNSSFSTHLPKGIYFVKIISNSKVYNTKIQVAG